MNNTAQPKNNSLMYILSFFSVVTVVTLIVLQVLGYFTPSVDCEVSDWGPCDPITGKRKRTVIKEKQGRGKDCPILEEDCPVNCSVSAWGTCTNGKQLRTIEREAKNGGTCEPLVQTCIVPFDQGDILNTPPQDYKNLHFLDRHPRICFQKPINSFKLDNINGKAQLNYKCSDNLVTDMMTVKTTNSLDTANISGLSRTPVECGVNEVVSNYGLGPGYKFNYDCLKSTTDLTCTERRTPRNSNIYAHNVVCGEDEVIGSIKVEDHGGDVVSYLYNCCKKVLPSI